MKLLIIFLLGFFAVICNVTQDEIRFRWGRLFGHWFKPGTKAEQWFNPSLSWENKWISEFLFVKFIMSTVFVWLTDFWHLLKFLIVSSIYVIILILLDLRYSFWEQLAIFALMHLLWGVIFEGFTRGIYGALSDKYIK